MIERIEQIPITDTSYPFASAEKYCKLSQNGYEETEYYMYGTANVYRSVDKDERVEVATADAPYINRFVVRAPKNPKLCSGNVVIEIVNPTSFMEIDRMWILGHKEFVRNGDIYIGITSKPNTIKKMVEFNTERYGRLSWKNPNPEVPFSFKIEEALERNHVLPDLDISYETGLFWDMLTDLAWLIRSDEDENPLLKYSRKYIYLTGWSQSACYLFRYVNSFAYRPEVSRGGKVFDGYLAGGGVRSLVTPINQYESLKEYSFKLSRIEKVSEPFIAVQTESENGRYDSWRTMRSDSDNLYFKYRLYEVTGASHDTMYSYVDYYQNDPDLKRIDHLPEYIGKHEEGNDYPSQILFAAAYRNLFNWVRTGAGPNHCERIKVDAEGENCKDAFGNTVGGLRTCLLNYPTGRYNSTSNIEVGMSMLDPSSDKDGLFGYEEAFSSGMLKELYGTIENYRKLVTQDTEEQISKGFVCKEDGQELIELALELARKRGL
ncbi:hypothetical protein CSC2_26520 [Clostridium zeae]|uniref:Alpha/beta hydrolase domain-containing protein n=1 Tax=Clostridium zeae TaxID=2759022 RepID=A0ABQ1EBM0_9CLOT|nr:alpha/beta hydrolase domain-containing protein [Clostridium zeae]GFZ32126.1 hypothetical protein CSC2_26520 [Clostridium zeae]